MNRLNRIVGVAALALVAAACGRGPELIDRTQPNYHKKSELLSGQWYLQETIVEAPASSPVAVVGFGGKMEKVRFEVQEDNLVAYRTYELIPGIDPMVDRQKSVRGKIVYLDGRPYRGAPVAAWPIVSHFDRQRQYNPATGEQTNVLEENQSDRPWYERQFIRVNWAQNQITDYDLVTGDKQGQAFASYVTPIDQVLGDSAFVTEYTTQNGKQELTYFDFTIRQYHNPPMVEYPNYGMIPYCWLDPTTDCESAEVKVRVSMRKVDEAHVQDYEPLPYTDKLQKKFGMFREDSISYDRNRGVTESGRILFADRHNIWERAHDSAGNVIEVADRTPKPIVYFLTPNFPVELLAAAENVEKSWDEAFRRAVAVPRGVEPNDPSIPQMFYVCRTPVAENDRPACGKPGFVARLGDLRYHLIPWVELQSYAGLLGLGPSSADPETGEIIHAVANVYGAGIDSWTGAESQILDVLSGETTLEQLITGEKVTDHIFANLNPTDPRRPLDGPWSSQNPLISDPQQPLGAFRRLKGNLETRVKTATQVGHLPYQIQDRRAVADALVAKNPALESELINAPEIRKAIIASVPNAAMRKRLETDSTLYRDVARSTMLGNGTFQKLAKKRLEHAQRMNGSGCAFLSDFADDAFEGLAKDMAKKYQARVTELQAAGSTLAQAKATAKTEAWNELRIAAFTSVAQHEVGHTLGLMHNFIGSFDAMNYLDGYWDLRKQTIGVMVGGQRVLPTLPQNLIDASKQNQAQIDGRMRELQYSSIMDYGSRQNSDIWGVGKYDKAAILFAYSGGGEPGYVEVFNDTRGKSAEDFADPNGSMPTDNAAKPYVIRGAHVEIPLAHVEHYTPVHLFYSDKFHYTTLPFQFADKNLPFEEALDQGIKRMQSRTFRKWSELEPMYAKMEAVLHEYNLSQGGWGRDSWETAQDIVGLTGKAIPIEVPFMYCSDYEVGANVACNRQDQGADVYEITRDWIERYQEYYAFNSFRRNRLNFSPGTYLNSIYARYLDNLPNVYQQWMFNIFWSANYYQTQYGWDANTLEQYGVVGQDPIIQNYWTMAVVDSVNTILQNLATPSAGYHGKTASGNWVHLPENNGVNGRLLDPNGQVGAREAKFIDDMKAASHSPQYADVVYVPRGPGRNMYTLTQDSGADGYTRTEEVGHFWDQYASLIAITTSDTNFLGVDRGADARKYYLPYYMTFDRELSDTFMNLWADDKGSYASGLVKTSNGEATVRAPVLVRGEDYIHNFVYPPPQPAPIDGTGNALPVEKIEASPTWSTKFYSEVFSMQEFSSFYDNRYATYNQVYRLGSGESLTPTAGFTIVKFDDPFGGYVFAAVKKDGDTRTPAAPAVIANANAYKAKWDAAKAANAPVDGLTAAQWESKVRETVRSLEVMRSLYNIFGNPI